MELPADKYRVKFIKKEQLEDDVFTYFFEKPSSFQMLAGQYLRWSMPDENTDERGTSRNFTNCSSPTEDHLSITTKRGVSTFKNMLFSLNQGDEVEFFGPLGRLFVTHEDQSPKLMIAGGIGVTPFRSILKFALDTKLTPPLTLLVSFALKKEIIFYDEIKEIEKNMENVKVIYTLTKEEVEGFETGRIDEDMIKKYQPDFLNSDIFIVGPPQMAEAMQEMVEAMGVGDDNIVRERFTGY